MELQPQPETTLPPVRSKHLCAEVRFEENDEKSAGVPGFTLLPNSQQACGVGSEPDPG